MVNRRRLVFDVIGLVGIGLLFYGLSQISFAGALAALGLLMLAIGVKGAVR
jgi:hypothetical protein